MLEDLIGERALQAEMIEYLGHDKHETVTNPTGNPRNGKSRKILKVNLVNCPSRFPRDRESNFEPQIISKMHNGNLSFVSEQGRHYDIAPAYDMTPMAFAPRSGGGLQSAMPEASICAGVTNETWRYAEQLACVFHAQMKASVGFSHRFGPCIAALENHIKTASAKIDRLG